MHMVGR